MANEAVIIELLGNAGDPMQFTVADGTAITKGTLMILSGSPRTMLASYGEGQKFVGILATDKVANDGQTMATVYTHCVADIKDSGSAIAVGALAKLGGANTIATADEAGAMAEVEVVGLVLETTSANEVVAVKISK